MKIIQKTSLYYAIFYAHIIPMYFDFSILTMVQWEFQEPKMKVPTIYKAYFLGLCKRISPQNMAKNMVLTYLHFRILKFLLIWNI